LRLLPVALALFYRQIENETLEVWVQVRTDDGPFHGLLEFPGGGVEAGETPLEAAVREVQEEVGISVNPEKAQFMGTYKNELPQKTILLYVFLFPDQPSLSGLGSWFKIQRETLSSGLKGKIPPMNHDMIDDLYRYLYDQKI
jgi:8-oxo-dGTP diphosphatase